MNDVPLQSAPSNPPDRGFLVILCVLVALITLTLSGLWILERRKRINAEQRLAQVMSATRMAGLPDPASFLAPGLSKPPLAPREELPTRTVQLDGTARSVFLVAPAVAKRLGLQSGDLLWVTDAP